MKSYAFIPVVAMIALAGCTQHLDDKDHALLTETHDMAQQAKNDAAQAAADAKAAHDAADKAAADAKSASDKADRMFQQSQNK